MRPKNFLFYLTMRPKKFAYIILICFVVSCKEEIKQIKINLENKEDIKLSTYFDSIELIPIKLDSLNLKLNITKFYETETKVYILDRKNTKSVLIYDKNEQRMIFSIGKFTDTKMNIDPLDIYIDQTSGDLEITDVTFKNIHVFDSIGNYKFSKKTLYIFNCYYKIDSSNIWYNGNFFNNNAFFNSYENYSLFNQVGQATKNKLLPYDTRNKKKSTPMIADNCFFNSINGIYFIRKGENSIYKYKNHHFNKEYEILFTKDKDSVLTDPKSTFINEIFFENDSIILQSLVNDGKQKIAIYDKNKKHSFIIGKINNDINSFNIFTFNHSNKEFIYAFLNYDFIYQTTFFKKSFSPIFVNQLVYFKKNYPQSSIILKLRVRK